MSSSIAENSKFAHSPLGYPTSPVMLIVLTLSVVAVFVVGFSAFCFCKFCFMSIRHTWRFQRAASETLVRPSPNNASSPPYRGLDPSLLAVFPTFPFASRTLKNCGRECAICLVEFEVDSMVRLITVCYHFFHQECIDLWLRSHKTCPVCRTDLDSPTKEARKCDEIGEGNEEERRDDVCIEVKDGEGDGDQRHNHDGGGDDDDVVSLSVRMEKRFVRSHTTGHSIVMIRGGDEGRDHGGDGDGDSDDDKYRLRLPENVAINVLKGGHGYRKSCSSYNDMTMVTRQPNAPCSNCGYDQRSGIENIMS